MTGICVHCGKDLPGRKIKYCSERCSYWFNAIENDKPKKSSISRRIRMARAEKSQRKGKVGCRYN
jgi:predicted nucleic acid-binding Zn ribbon protein